jgi:hypothetical protein
MRPSAVLPVLGVLALIGAIAIADPIAADRWSQILRQGTPARKREIVRSIVDSIQRGSEVSIAMARLAVISDDPAVRAPLIDALIAAKVIDKTTAAQVPTASALQRRIRQLLPKEKPDQLPAATDCMVTGGTNRGAELTCHVSRCPGSCRHETRDLTITTGVRWAVVKDQHRATDDGTCGDCTFVE